MKKKQLIEMADAYSAEHGFMPGALHINRRDAEKELKELIEDSDIPKKNKEVLVSLIEKDVNNAEKMPVMGLRVVLDDDGCEKPRLERDSGDILTIKPKDAKEFYRPNADIVNSMKTILKASFMFFEEVRDDKPFLDFAENIAGFTVGDHKGTWEDNALPELQKIVADFVENSPNANMFMIKFFMCTLDFYWHCRRNSTEESGRVDRPEFDKAIMMSSVIRTMPEYMRKEYMDHLACHGMLSSMLGG